MIVKVGAAAKRSHLAAANAMTTSMSSRRVTSLCACVASAKGGLSSVRHLHPLRVRRGIGDVTLVPVPPLVRPALRIALRRILPQLVAPKRRHVEVAPDGAHRLVAAAVDEIGAEYTPTVADERVVAVPLIHTEVDVETVSDGIPWDLLPTHSRLKARNVGLRCARHIHQRRVTRIQVSEIGNLVGPQRTPNAGMLRPAMYAGLKEGAIDDQLT